MKVLMLWDYYPIYLSYFYQKYPEVLDLPFEEHRQQIFDDHFGWPADLGQYMSQQGIETEFIIENAEILQKKWAEENAFTNFDDRNWKIAIALEQIRRFNPHLLFKPNPSDDFHIYLDESRGHYKMLMYYLGYKIPRLDVLERADYFIAPHSRRILKTYPHLKNVSSVHVGFNPLILDKIGCVEKTYDVVFVGNITPEHQRRAEVLAYLIESGIAIKVFGEMPGLGKKYLLRKGIDNLSSGRLGQGFKSLANAFFGSDYMKNVQTIKTVLKPPVFGLEYYHTLAKARIGLNIHNDIAQQDLGGNMRMFETTGVGTCLVADDLKTNSQLFKPGKEIIAFRSKEHLLDLLKNLDLKSKQVQDIAHAGQQKTLKEHSIKQMFEDIVSLVK